MPQFRLTRKFAQDLKITHLDEPQDSPELFDDWFIDVLRIDRKKVALITHAKSLFSLLVPYNMVGGAKNVPMTIKQLLIDFVLDHQLTHLKEEINLLFNQPFRFTKTKDRRVLGHMNDFCYHVLAHASVRTFDEINWRSMIVTLNDTLAGNSKGGYDRPYDLMLDLLGAREKARKSSLFLPL